MNNKPKRHVDVAIIGAGPAGTVAAALLNAKGHQVRILERQHFPRFSIGESLLPQCMEFLSQAGLLDAVLDQADPLNFQFKNGAAFVRRDQTSEFDFTQKFSAGWGTTYQVQRAPFDHLLAQQVEKMGIPIDWGHEITEVDISDSQARLLVHEEQGNSYELEAQFVLDASGFGRVLPRLLDLDRPSDFPSRTSLFTHIEDGIDTDSFDRNKILITVHHQHNDVWFWLIPFSNGRCSLGVVAEASFLEIGEKDLTTKLQQLVNSEPTLKRLLGSAKWDTPARQITGYSSDVSSLWGPRFALLGNAGEFLDPVFSSGVTIAMKSASLAAATLDRQLRGESVDWQEGYALPLQSGVDTFRVFVQAWYDGRFQDVIFAANQSQEVRAMISSILAGYAWDQENPYVRDSARRLNTLVELCRNA